MHIGIIGTGYVGLVTGACFAEFGVFVTCVDKDEKKIRSLRKGTVPFYEPGLDDLVQRNIKQGRLTFSTKIADVVNDCLVIFIAVGTPPRGDGSADLKYVDEVAGEIAWHMNGYKVIVTKSTVPVGTGKRIARIISQNQRAKSNFDIVSNPEFLREGAAIEDFMRPNRVIIGANSQQAIAILKDLYNPLYLIETPFVITNIETAELIKHASNSFLAAKISFINEIANLCEKVGADVHDVSRAMGLDGRIGKKFLHPGPGFGGSCFPKDTRALSKIAKEKGYSFKILEAVIQVNEEQRRRMIGKISEKVGDLKGKAIGVLGLSFKPNTNDIRESSSIVIIQGLVALGAKVKAFDPAAMEEAKRVLPGIEFGKDAYDVARGGDALVLATEWNQFRRLDLQRIKGLLRTPVFIDLRNVYDPDHMRQLGFDYCGVGR